MSDRYSRQEGLVKLPTELHIVGCGGIGSNVAIQAAIAGVQILNLYDNDVFSSHNFNRVPIPIKLAGKKKTSALKEFITKQINPDCKVLDFGRIDTDVEAEILSNVTMICVDNGTVRTKLMKILAKNKVKFVSASYDGHVIDVSTVPEEIWANEEAGSQGYTMPSWVVPATMSAAIALDFAAMPNPPKRVKVNAHDWRNFTCTP